MRRRAILVSDNGYGDINDYIPTTKEDIKNYKNFIMSNIGGAWENDEIESYTNPNCDIIDNLKNKEYDYTITMVSSHGGVKKENRKLYLYLNNKEYDCISFINKSRRQLMIFDCCRTFFEEDDDVYKQFSCESNKINLSNLYKKRYNNYIKTCEEGIIILYSCQIGQASGLDQYGSYFINSLILAAKDRIKSNDIVTVKEALELSKKYIKKYPTIQIPEINQIKRIRYFPIAVNI